MKILYVCSEMVPYIKTGGLADVTGNLPRALAARGHEVRVALPRYHGITTPLEYLADFPVPMGDHVETGILKHDPTATPPVWFIENHRYFHRHGIHGDEHGDFGDNHRRYAFFCRAVLEALWARRWFPDVIHLNDWQTGLVATYLKTRLAGVREVSQIRTVFTVHNMAYQGNFAASILPVVGLEPWLFNGDCLEFYGHVSYLKAGLVFSDILTTVSPTYAREIQTEAYGCGLHGVLHRRRQDLVGILNGADYEVWNPETDPHLQGLNYSARDLRNKEEVKKRLLMDCGLPYRRDVPLFAMVSRLVDQKGIDLLATVLDEILSWPMQLVVLGTGFPMFQDMLRQTARRHTGKMATLVKFDEGWAHRIEAAADFFLMPSRYEPCGLNQIYSLRYGAVPVVRQTGGLADTVIDYRTDPQRGNGLVFSNFSSWALKGAIAAALDLFTDRKYVRKLRVRGMASRYTWDQSAAEYEALYGRARTRSSP